ncbi:hypothetical protein QNO07_10480 [Streptomyces sp. 549]|uniref:hypothetical protein n=1 Tax=Streptomyces sp. 549 TaxID=3049076 RepID=UPI0024C3A1DC|nr:hypothetical protein [Streptomyces sp. 549]MDK1473841.1 hypothetical protein [Streptomyces sp. 549]
MRPPPTPTAVLLSPRLRTVRAARRVGARTLVVGPDLAAPGMRQTAAEADGMIEADWSDRRALVGALGAFARHDRAAVFGFDPASALAASWANAALRLPGNPPPVVAALTDPAVLRDRTNQFTAHPVRFELCEPAALAKAAAKVGFPCTVVPRGTTPAGNHTLRDAASARELATTLPDDAPLLVEQYLPGPRYEAEAHSFGGAHTVLAVRPDLRPDEDLDEEPIRRLVGDVLDAIDYRVGPSLVSVAATPDGPRLLTARPGAGRDSGLCALTVAAQLDLPPPADHAQAG